MKLTKTVLAVAVAGIAASVPTIASADTTLSGVVQLQLRGSDADGDAGDARFGAGDVLVGVSTNHELNSGLTGYGSLRLDLDRLSNDGRITVVNGVGEDDDVDIGTAGTADSVFVGFRGAFGDIRIGEVPSAVEYGQLSADIFDVSGEINGGISYTGTFGPASIIGTLSPEQNQDVAGVGAKFNFAGVSIGVGADNRNDNSNFAIGAGYTFAGAAITAHFWTQETDGAGGDVESFAVKVGYGWSGISAAISFTARENDLSTGDGAVDDNAVRLDVGYQLGGGMDISTRIQNDTNNAADTDSTNWRIQLSKSF